MTIQLVSFLITPRVGSWFGAADLGPGGLEACGLAICSEVTASAPTMVQAPDHLAATERG